MFPSNQGQHLYIQYSNIKSQTCNIEDVSNMLVVYCLDIQTGGDNIFL